MKSVSSGNVGSISNSNPKKRSRSPPSSTYAYASASASHGSFTMELEEVSKNSQYGKSCIKVTHDGVEFIIHFCKKSEVPETIHILDNPDIIQPLRTLKKTQSKKSSSSGLALMFCDYEMTLSWFINSAKEKRMEIEYEDKNTLKPKKVYCFSDTMKDILKKVIRILIWLHQEGYTHTDLTARQILLTLEQKNPRKFAPKLTNYLEKHDLCTKEAKKKFRESRRKNWKAIRRIVREIIQAQGKIDYNEEIEELLRVLKEKNLKKKAYLLRDSPSLWTESHRLNYTKILHNAMYSATPPNLHISQIVGGGPGKIGNWMSSFPLNVIQYSESKIYNGHYTSSDQDFIRFIRNVCEHEHDFRVQKLIGNATEQISSANVWIRRKISNIYVDLLAKWHEHLEEKKHTPTDPKTYWAIAI